MLSRKGSCRVQPHTPCAPSLEHDFGVPSTQRSFGSQERQFWAKSLALSAGRRSSGVLGRFSTYLDAVAQSLPQQHRKLVRGDLYLTLLDWFTEGVPAKDAAQRLKRALAG